MIVASPVGQYISIGAGGRGGGGMGRSFPGSLMGYIAYVRQIYLDADHYKLVKDTYAKNPVGMTRPEYDRALEGVLDSPRILLPANRLVEIDRMLHLAADLKQPVILYGGRETFRPEAAALLKKFNAPILLSMRWPEAGARRRSRRGGQHAHSRNPRQGRPGALRSRRRPASNSPSTPTDSMPRATCSAPSRRRSTTDSPAKTPCAPSRFRPPRSTASPIASALSRRARSPTS